MLNTRIMASIGTDGHETSPMYNKISFGLYSATLLIEYWIWILLIHYFWLRFLIGLLFLLFVVVVVVVVSIHYKLYNTLLRTNKCKQTNCIHNIMGLVKKSSVCCCCVLYYYGYFYFHVFFTLININSWLLFVIVNFTVIFIFMRRILCYEYRSSLNVELHRLNASLSAVSSRATDSHQLISLKLS